MSNYTKLGALTKIKTGKLDANASSADGIYPFFTCSREPLKINSYSYDCECVLVAGNGELNVKYYKGKFDAYQRTYIIEVNDNNVLLPKYLYYFLDLYVETLRLQSIGGIIKYIKLGNLTEAEIPLFSIKEQKNIVNQLDKCKNLIEQRKLQLQKLDNLVKSQFIEMFGAINSADYVDMASLCKIITDGTHQPPKFVDEGIPFLFVSNLANNEISYETTKFIDRDTYNRLIKRTPIAVGDILLSTVGSYGHPAIVKSDNEFCFQRHIAYLKPNCSMVDSVYLYGALLSADCQRQIEEKVKGIAQKTLNLSEIKKLMIPLPDKIQQNEFARFVEQTDKSKFRIKQSLEKLETCYKALLQKYFG